MPVSGWWQPLALCVVLLALPEVTATFLTPCESPIYCTGELLQQVQMAGLFEDDKHFVDMPLKEEPKVVLEQFQQLLNATPGRTLSKQQLAAFVEQHFLSPGQELETWEPPDWTESPPVLQRISDATLRLWAQALNAKWKHLGRQMKSEIQASPQRHSIIFVPHPLIVPGGRFIEYYYWDSFWVIEGLLLCNMTATAKGMIQNFLFLVETYGHIPNGGRIYYERRSQPPFLTLMVDSYLKHTNDSDFLRNNIRILETEYHFWQEHRAVNVSLGGENFSLNYYNVQVGAPRPESYKKDMEAAAGLGEDAQQQLWAALHSAAESGWDFSSRWFLPGPPPLPATLQDTQTSAVVPVDLNAILCKVELLLASFYRALGNSEKASLFETAYAQRMAAVHAVLWNDKNGVWMDYNLLRQRHNEAFYPSNLTPLWAECGVNSTLAEKALRYLEGSPALSFPNGLPTSLARTGQQWDLPNAWAPLQQMVIAGLAKSSSPQAQALAFTLAQNWVRTNLAVYNKYQQMFEKYDVEGDGNPGGGGEYEVQEGFGWTNGVALQLLDLYGDRLTSADSGLASSRLWVGSCLLLLWSRICL